MKSVICLIFLTISTVAFAGVKIHPLSDDFINLINSKKTTWKAGRNFPINTPLSQIRKLMGSLENPDEKIAIKVHSVESTVEIPEFFDAREQWPECRSIREIRDQSACASCWAVAAVEAMSDRICIHSNGTKQISVSAEDLLSCCEFGCGYGCDGGFAASAWDFWIYHGLVSGGEYGTTTGCKAYPFQPCSHQTGTSDLPPCISTYVSPSCVKECDEGSNLIYDEDVTFGDHYYTLQQNETQIQLEIMLNGPVEASYVVYQDFLSFKSGIYQHVEGTAAGSHAVKIIGWGVENDIPYWTIANSWNPSWGDNGFFKILRGVNHVGIEEHILGGIPKL